MAETNEDINNQIENNFTYHTPKDGDIAKYELLRGTAKDFAYVIENFCPSSREKSLAMTNLENSVFWANASIARKQ